MSVRVTVREKEEANLVHDEAQLRAVLAGAGR
jgi:hypothetical protein